LTISQDLRLADMTLPGALINCVFRKLPMKLLRAALF